MDDSIFAMSGSRGRGCVWAVRTWSRRMLLVRRGRVIVCGVRTDGRRRNGGKTLGLGCWRLW